MINGYAATGCEKGNNMSLEIFIYKCKSEDYLRRRENPDAVAWMCLESYLDVFDFPLPMDMMPEMTQEQHAEHSCRCVTICHGAQIYNWLIHNTEVELGSVKHVIFEKEKIVKLRDVCNEVFENGFDEDGSVNEVLCRELLPILEGYDFSYDDGYDYDYIDDVYITRDILNSLLEDTNFADEVVLVKAAW